MLGIIGHHESAWYLTKPAPYNIDPCVTYEQEIGADFWSRFMATFPTRVSWD